MIYRVAHHVLVARNGKLVSILIMVSMVILFSIPCYASSLRPDALEIMGGHIWSPVIYKTQRHTINYYIIDVRGELFHFKQSFSFLMGMNYANATKGTDGFMAGFTLFLRYNFLPFNTGIYPYFQIGAGILYNDIYEDYKQDIIGNNIEFNPQAALGFKYPITETSCLNFELHYQHISNAGLDDRNIGLNGAGFLFGISFKFNP